MNFCKVFGWVNAKAQPQKQLTSLVFCQNCKREIPKNAQTLLADVLKMNLLLSRRQNFSALVEVSVF